MNHVHTQYISSEENICYNTNCLSSPVNQFTLDYGSTKKCFYKCDETTNYKFYYEVNTRNNQYKCIVLKIVVELTIIM